VETVRDLTYNGYTAVLLRYEDGQPALWVQDEYLAGNSDVPAWTFNDINEKLPVDPDENLVLLVDWWKAAVGWDDKEVLA
jgi:hypothetical protein